MEIKRDRYLNQLIAGMGNGMIKVVTGLRRCGKSYLLMNIFHRYLTEHGVDDSHIVEVALDDRRNKALRDPDRMLEYVDSRVRDSGKYYIILDEVQLLGEFEDVLNSFLHMPNVDAYVTGSNSKFLSNDVITEFRGRGDEIRIYPLSFSEFFSAYGGTEEEAWNEYYTYGGLPAIASFDTSQKKMNYLKSLFLNVYSRDIIERYKIRDDAELEEVVNILASSIGSLTNPNKLANTFRSAKRPDVSYSTINSYLKYLQEAFMIQKASRYDVKGRKYINSLSKYYFTDIGVRNARLDFRQQEENHIMENIIYNELRVRGFSVDVGLVEINTSGSDGKHIRKQLEVDFVANRGSRRYYVQSAFEMATGEKREQEERPLLKIGDSFKKIIVVKDNIMLKRDEFGIATMGIRQFLLDGNSLDL